MSTDAQLAANLSNSLHSTGPRTDAGKAASSLNHLRHGFRSQSVLLPGEDPADYHTLLADLTLHFTPSDLTEERCVREMADAEWRLRRVRQSLESALTRRIAALALDCPDAAPEDLHSLAIATLAITGTSYATWLRYETKFERQYDRAHKEWSRYQATRRSVALQEADIWMKRALFGPLPPGAAPETLVQDGQNANAQFRDLTAQVAAHEAIATAADQAGKLASNVQNAGPAPATPSQTPRSAPCSCGSGEKYKRCCGRTAPPVLTRAA